MPGVRAHKYVYNLIQLSSRVGYRLQGMHKFVSNPNYWLCVMCKKHEFIEEIDDLRSGHGDAHLKAPSSDNNAGSKR